MPQHDPIQEFSADLGVSREALVKWLKAEKMPVAIPPAMRESIARIKAIKIRRAAGSTC